METRRLIFLSYCYRIGLLYDFLQKEISLFSSRKQADFYKDEVSLFLQKRCLFISLTIYLTIQRRYVAIEYHSVVVVPSGSRRDR